MKDKNQKHKNDIRDLPQTKIYQLQLHERKVIAGLMEVTRVPGGWIYTDKYGDTFNSVFVPLSDEFNQE